MKKIARGVFLAALMAAMTVQADYLAWTVDFSASGAYESPMAGSVELPCVWLVATTDPLSSQGGKVLASNGGIESVQLSKDSSGFQRIGVGPLSQLLFADLEDMNSSAYTFYVEMGAEAGMADYVSEGFSYDDLVSQGMVKSDMGPVDSFLNAAFSSWTPTHNVPEPTGGVLVLVGAALLALRRKAVERA